MCLVEIYIICILAISTNNDENNLLIEDGLQATRES